MSNCWITDSTENKVLTSRFYYSKSWLL